MCCLSVPCVDFSSYFLWTTKSACELDRNNNISPGQPHTVRLSAIAKF